MSYQTTKISVGPGECLMARRDAARGTVTVKAATVPTTTSFIVTTAEAAKIRKGDILAPAGTTPANTVAEASAYPRITDIAASGSDWAVTVSPAFGVAPAAGAAIVIAYEDLGATDGDIVLRAQVELEKLYIDQTPDPVAAILRSREVGATLPLAENTIDNFAMALGVAPSADGLTLNIGDSVPTVREDRLLLILPAPDGKKRWVMLNRVVNEGESSLVASKTNKGIINLNLTALQDTTMGTASLGALKDV